jgi:hypothetical protein
VLNGGSNFVTERFLENSGFSLEIMGAKRKTKQSAIRNANEKFSLPFRNAHFFLNRNMSGIINKNRSTDKTASMKLKFTTAVAAFMSFKSNPK